MTSLTPIEEVEYKRALYITIYDLQGGPFPERARLQIENDLQKVAEAYTGLAITVVEE